MCRHAHSLLLLEVSSDYSAHHRLKALRIKIRKLKTWESYKDVQTEYEHCQLEARIDVERQFKTAKRLQAPGDATVLKRFFRDNFITFRCRSNRIAFLESMNFSTCVYMQISNFGDGHMPTFRHCSGPISAKCLIADSSYYSKRHTSESRLSVGTIGLG